MGSKNKNLEKLLSSCKIIGARSYFVISPIVMMLNNGLELAPVNKTKIIMMSENENVLFGIDKLNIPRSEIPAVTHVDYSARVQTVHKETNPRYHKLLTKFEEKTGCATIVNTSFNVRGEPMVCTPEDSYRCFMRTEMDVLVIDNFLLFKSRQPNFQDKGNWQEEFELD